MGLGWPLGRARGPTLGLPHGWASPGLRFEFFGTLALEIFSMRTEPDQAHPAEPWFWAWPSRARAYGRRTDGGFQRGGKSSLSIGPSPDGDEPSRTKWIWPRPWLGRWSDLTPRGGWTEGDDDQVDGHGLWISAPSVEGDVGGSMIFDPGLRVGGIPGPWSMIPSPIPGPEAGRPIARSGGGRWAGAGGCQCNMEVLPPHPLVSIINIRPKTVT